MIHRTIDAIQRREGGQILAGLIRFCGDFDRAEEALQEAYAIALKVWPTQGLPNNAAAWLTTVAKRQAIDHLRRDGKLTSLNETQFAQLPAHVDADPAHVAEQRETIEDDQLRLIFTCCHPALAPQAQAALALRTLCQLTVAEIARAYVEPEATTAQRLVRAKRKIAEARIPYVVPTRDELPARLETVLNVIYLVFNEGYVGAHSQSLMRVDLCAEAIRLGRLVMTLLPREAEPIGLTAMMMLHDARRDARVSPEGDLIPLEEQDRSLWHHDAIAEAVALLDQALMLRTPGPYQIEAAMAALHCQAKRADETDWQQISALYGALWRHRQTEIVALNAAVAYAMAYSIRGGLERIDRIAAKGELDQYHLLHAARADLFRRSGQKASAAAAYSKAIALCTNEAEKRYLQRRLAGL